MFAPLVAKLLKSMGVLQHGQLVQCKRGDLVAGYVGQTALKTEEVVQSALGGVLFIDEAYSLVHGAGTGGGGGGGGGGGDPFGEEALTVLLDCMEQHRRELVAAMEEARQQRARDNARLDEMQRKLSAIELQNEARLEENQRLEEEARASERAQRERQEDYLRMQRALSLLGPSRTAAAALTPLPAGALTPASARADRGLTPGRTPAGAGGAALSTPGASSAQRQRGAVSRQMPGSRANVDWLKGAMSPASGVDMLDRLEQRPSIANLPGPPRTPGLFFGCKR